MRAKGHAVKIHSRIIGMNWEAGLPESGYMPLGFKLPLNRSVSLADILCPPLITPDPNYKAF